MTGLGVPADVAEVANPRLLADLVWLRDAGHHSVTLDRYAGSRLIVPLGPSGRPVIATSGRALPLFTDLEACQAWLAPVPSFA